ncbi:MAG TPA: ketopantoate reductase family protein [Planctomycetota bacterium]|nr:ketopantoate reductase family protein [Planctomycetota bacterium]
MAFERAVIYGAGAVGSYLGARLASVLPTVLIARREHVEAIRGRGLFVRGDADLFVPPGRIHAATGLPALGPGALVLVTVKLDALEDAGAELARQSRPDTVFLLAQNGLNGRELFLKGAARPLATARAIASCGVDFREAGKVEYWGGGLSLEKSEHSAELVGLFRRAGIETVESPDFGRALWKKLAVNCVANPLTALLGVRNSEVVTPVLAGLRHGIVAEVSALAAAEGQPLPPDMAERVDQALAASRNRSSMLQDVQRGRPTEIEHLNGFVASRSTERGMDAPVNAALSALIRARSETAVRT